MFRTTMGAFVITLVSLTVVMWFTQAIREFDLITSQRQTMFVFIGITGLLIPLLVMMIAPISLVLATAHIINKLSSDSGDRSVMNAAESRRGRWSARSRGRACRSCGWSPRSPFISPWSLRELRDWATVRADILTNIVQPGASPSEWQAHLPHRRSKANGLLVGIFLDDRRDPKEHATYLAEQGEIVKKSTLGPSWSSKRAACSGSNSGSAILGLSLSDLTLSTCQNSASVSDGGVTYNT
jgi:lipopolysaccharide export system permease protein